MPKESNLEFKVGLFVLIALVGLVLFIFSISDSSVLQQGKTVHVIFEFTNGLKKNAPVRIAGVEEGIVSDVRLFFNRADSKTKAEVFLRIKNDIQLPQDSTVTVNQLGLLGEQYVEIIPGVSTQDFIKDGDTMMGKDPIAQSAISERIWKVAEKVESTVGGVDKMVNDEDNVQAIKQTFENLRTLTGEVNSIVIDMRAGKGTMGRLFYDTHLYDNLEGLTADLKANPWKLLYRPK